MATRFTQVGPTPSPAAGGAVELATTGAPVSSAAAAPPTVGQVATALTATTWDWQTPSGGDITIDPVVKTADFTAVANTQYYVEGWPSGDKNVILPASPNVGDRVVIIGLGAADLANLSVYSLADAVEIGVLNEGPGFAVRATVRCRNAHLDLVFSNVSGGTRWRDSQNGVNTLFASAASVQTNSIAISTNVGTPVGLSVAAQSIVFRGSSNVVSQVVPQNSILIRGSGDLAITTASTTSAGVLAITPFGGGGLQFYHSDNGGHGELSQIVNTLPGVNSSGVSLPTGTPVFISGATAAVNRSKADAAGTAKFAGVSASIYFNSGGNWASGANGWFTAGGWANVGGAQTGTWVAGDFLYVDPDNAGKITNVKPTTSGQYIVPVGTCLNTPAGGTAEILIEKGTITLIP